MARLVTAAEKIKRARELIQEAWDYPVPERGGKYDLSYMATVRGKLREARELVQFIPRTAGATVENKEEAKKIIAEAEQAGKDIFKSPAG